MLALLSSNVYPGASVDMRIAVYPKSAKVTKWIFQLLETDRLQYS